MHTVTTSAGEEAFAIYEAPLDFVRTDADESLQSHHLLFLAEFTPDSGGPLSQTIRSLFILRPPVILVHGLWADPGTWDSFKPLIGDPLKRFQVHRADYSIDLISVTSTDPPVNQRFVNPPIPITEVNSNSLGVLYNAEIILPQVKDYIESFRNRSNPLSLTVAAIQADFVAHSLGGLVTRALPLLSNFLSGDTFGKGVIHKLITVGTPHLGTQVAFELLKDENQCVRNEILSQRDMLSFRSVTLAPSGRQVTGAVFDLQGDGIGGNLNETLRAIQRQAQVRIPTALVVGHMSQEQLNALGCSGPLCIPAIIRLECAGDPFADSFTPVGWPTIVRGDSDGIVPLTSQRNNLSEADVTNISPAIHSQGTEQLGFAGPHLQEEASGTPQKVINLLNTSINNDNDYILLP